MIPGGFNLSFTDEEFQVRKHDELNRGDVKPRTDQVEQENAVIVDSDAVVNPQAVMVEAIDALIADVAVEALFWPQDLARRTNISLVKVLIEL